MPLDMSRLKDPAKTWDKVHSKGVEYQVEIPEYGWKKLKQAFAYLVREGATSVLDLGCGVGNALETLSKTFQTVVALDIAPKSIEFCKKLCNSRKLRNVTCVNASMTDMGDVQCDLDVIVTLNSLTVPSIQQIKDTLMECHRLLEHSKGHLLGVLPSMDSYHFEQLVLIDHNMKRGLSEDEAKTAVMNQGYKDLDFRYGRTTGFNVLQHFWTPHEIEYRLSQAGFELLELEKIHLTWSDATYLKVKEPMLPWDWFFLSKVKS